MHLLDLVLIVIIAGWAISGAFSGIAQQLNTLLSIIAGALGAWFFYPIVSYKLEGLIQSPTVSVMITPILLFIILGLLAKVIINLIFKIVLTEETNKNGWLLGGAFGLLKGLIVGGVLVYFLGQYGKPELIEDSVSFKRYYHASEWIVNTNEECGISTKISEACEYLREAVLPPQDLREESIESATKSFYNDRIAGYFEKDFFKGVSEFFSNEDDSKD